MKRIRGIRPAFTPLPREIPKNQKCSNAEKPACIAQRVSVFGILLFERPLMCWSRATEGSRTLDRTITNRLLYQLSYGGVAARLYQQILELIKSAARTKSGFSQERKCHGVPLLFGGVAVS